MIISINTATQRAVVKDDKAQKAWALERELADFGEQGEVAGWDELWADLQPILTKHLGVTYE
jgi:hypothetical protein